MLVNIVSVVIMVLAFAFLVDSGLELKPEITRKLKEIET